MTSFSASVGILNNIILQKKKKKTWSDMTFLLDTNNTDKF